MSKELLQKELDFYQLPCAEELGIELLPSLRLVHSSLSPMAELFHEILTEIKTCHFSDQQCLHIFLYHKRDGVRWEGKRRVMIMPPRGYQITEYLIDRGHAALARTMSMGVECNVSQCSGGKIVGVPHSTDCFRILEFKEGPMLEILNEEAAKFRMVFSPNKLRFGPHGKKSEIHYLKMEYR